MPEIAEKVKKIIVDKLGVDERKWYLKLPSTNDLGADSLWTIVELISGSSRRVQHLHSGRTG